MSRIEPPPTVGTANPSTLAPVATVSRATFDAAVPPMLVNLPPTNTEVPSPDGMTAVTSPFIDGAKVVEIDPWSRRTRRCRLRVSTGDAGAGRLDRGEGPADHDLVAHLGDRLDLAVEDVGRPVGRRRRHHARLSGLDGTCRRGDTRSDQSDRGADSGDGKKATRVQGREPPRPGRCSQHRWHPPSSTGPSPALATSSATTGVRPDVRPRFCRFRRKLWPNGCGRPGRTAPPTWASRWPGRTTFPYVHEYSAVVPPVGVEPTLCRS